MERKTTNPAPHYNLHSKTANRQGKQKIVIYKLSMDNPKKRIHFEKCVLAHNYSTKSARQTTNAAKSRKTGSKKSAQRAAIFKS